MVGKIKALAGWRFWSDIGENVGDNEFLREVKSKHFLPKSLTKKNETIGD